MELPGAANHSDIARVLLQAGALLLAARGLGTLARKWGQPGVVGEIAAGILLGPSLLGWALPSVGAWLAPQTATQGQLLSLLALLGSISLLLVTGLETDLGLIRRQLRTALGVSLCGVAVTFASGFFLGQLLPDDLLGNPDQRLVFSLFLATAMAISAIPVLARVLMELDLMRRNVGQTMLAAGMSDDTLGWILLSIIIALSAGQAVTLATVAGAFGTVIGFFVLSLLVGRWVIRPLFRWGQRQLSEGDRLVSLTVALTLLWAALTQSLGLEAVLGAFVMGIILGQWGRLPGAVVERLESFSHAVFAPLFFAVAGLKVDLPALLSPRLAALTLLVIAVATVGKITGTYIGARLVGRQDHWTALSFGAGLNARGAVEIIIATIGLSLGLLSQELFSIIVVMAIATSLMAPPALRFVLQRVVPGAEEKARLRREELEAASQIAGIRRVLIPVRWRAELGSAAQRLEARLLTRLAAGRPLQVSLLTVLDEQTDRERALADLRQLAKLLPIEEVDARVIEPRDPAHAILDEAAKGYDLILLGATEAPLVSPAAPEKRDHLFNPVVDEVVRLAPCSTLVVHAGGLESDWAPRRVLVPTNGSRASRSAAELAFALAGTAAERVVLLNVIASSTASRADHAGSERMAAVKETQREIVEKVAALGVEQGIRTEALMKTGDLEENVVRLAEQDDIDLIVLGTEIRPGSRRLFLGTRVERILLRANRPVFVLNIA